MKITTDMSPAEIRIALIRTGGSQARIAHEVGVTPQMVYKVIEGFSVSERVERAIARAARLEVERIWPSRYLNRGRRKVGRPRAVNQ